MLYFTFINLHERPDQEIIDIASVTDWNLQDNQDLFFGDEKNRPKPRIQEEEIDERTESEIVETSGLASKNSNLLIVKDINSYDPEAQRHSPNVAKCVPVSLDSSFTRSSPLNRYS